MGRQGVRRQPAEGVMRILLVEDEQGVARFIKKGLEEEGFSVDHAGDGEGGLELAALGGYDVMIVDVMLPGMDGMVLCRRLRSSGNQTPILMLTVRSHIKDKVAGLDAGADDYLTKPFSFEEFLARVRALMRRRGQEIVSLTCGNLVLNAVERRTEIDHTPMELRPKEFAVLEFLLRNQGRPTSRTRILENVWGYDFDPATNILDVHIARLREKLESAGAQVRIRTVRGVGYQLEMMET